MRAMTVFWIILLCSTLFSFGYLLWGLLWQLRRKKKEEQSYEDDKIAYLIRFTVMLLCPLVGPLYFIVSQLLYLLLFRQDVDLEDVIFSKERVETHVHADEERERNMVPLEEAIAVSDKGSLRTLMLNVIKGDIQHSLASIALALNSQDSETSHYAASVLQDELNNFRVNVQKIYEEIEKEQETEIECEQYLIPYMNSVLVQKVFKDMEQENFVRLFVKTGEILYRKSPWSMTSQFYEWICLRLLDIQEFGEMEKWCDRAYEQYPKALSSYTCRLKLYFTAGQKEKFFQVMEELKNTDIVIDKETLELIRIFS